MKKKLIALLSVLTVAFSLTACSLGELGLGIIPNNSNTASGTNTDSVTETDTTDTGDDNETEEVSEAERILTALYSLKAGEYAQGPFTLTGKIIALDKWMNPTIVVEGFEDMPVYCYKLVVSNKVGEVITVTAGKMTNYDGKYEFMDCTLISGESSGNGGDTSNADFSASEKALFNEYFGFVIPFIESDEYYVEEYEYYREDYDETEIGVNYYAYGLTSTEFNTYKVSFSKANGYTNNGTAEDEYGDTWYYYTKNDHYIDLSYYVDEYGDYILDVYVYDVYEGDLTGESGNQGGSGDNEDGGNSGNQGGSGDNEDGGNSGNQGGTDSGTTENADLLTNAGKGLPQGQDGVYSVDFTKATYVKNVTEQGYYLNGCPTVGSPKVLVIPVEFSDCTAQSKGYSVDKIKEAFEKDGKTDYFSVYDYYYTSSYGKLSLDITVLDEWFKPAQSSSHYKSQTMDYYGEETAIGDQMIMNEALAYLDNKGWDLSQFDLDDNKIIDAVVMINTLDIDSEQDFHWAYRYWNIYTDNNDKYYEYDGVSANDYLWAPYQFLHDDGNGYDNTSGMNTYTFIHEFGHILGADDYYDTSYTNDYGPMEGYDIMDMDIGDHNAFTKFNYGWLTTSRLVVAEDSVTLTLEDFSKNGDTIIIANNWDEKLGAYQEYYVLVYYKNTGLNDETNGGGYFESEGVLVYHINASLYKEVQDGETYYDIYNNNTDASDEYGTEDNLIEFVKTASGKYVFTADDSLPANVKDDNGNALKYTFIVNSVTENSVSITFTKK